MNLGYVASGSSSPPISCYDRTGTADTIHRCHGPAPCQGLPPRLPSAPRAGSAAAQPDTPAPASREQAPSLRPRPTGHGVGSSQPTRSADALKSDACGPGPPPNRRCLRCARRDLLPPTSCQLRAPFGPPAPFVTFLMSHSVGGCPSLRSVRSSADADRSLLEALLSRAAARRDSWPAVK